MSELTGGGLEGISELTEDAADDDADPDEDAGGEYVAG